MLKIEEQNDKEDIGSSTAEIHGALSISAT
jgi:hypothetical protein